VVKRFILVLLCAGLCACSSASVTPSQSTVAIIATTPALENLVQDWIADFPSPDNTRFELHTLSPLEVSRAIEDDMAALAIVGSTPPDDVFVTPLYEEGIAVIVHPQNDIRSISLEDLDGLIEGRITNWSELSGEDIPVQAVIPLSADETRLHFERLVLPEGTASVKALLAPTPIAMIEMVSENPGAVGYLPFSSLTEDVRAIGVDNLAPTSESVSNGRYPLVIPVIAYAQEEPLGALREWILAIQSPDATATP
jgi:ABC-type phosphate transport system substrate-binding protein